MKYFKENLIYSVKKDSIKHAKLKTVSADSHIVLSYITLKASYVQEKQHKSWRYKALTAVFHFSLFILYLLDLSCAYEFE